MLARNGYPGRGVVWARTLDGGFVAAYFLTGRTAASQARELRLWPDELVVATTADGDHDALRHYVAARERAGRLVYGNGEQVAQVAERLEAGRSPADALSGLAYEPDPPLFTPRITAVVDLTAEEGESRVWFGSARRPRGLRESADVMVVALGELAPGDVVLMTTYRSEGRTPVTAEPYVEVGTGAADRSALLAEIWDALDPELRVAAAAFTPGRLAAAELRHRRTG